MGKGNWIYNGVCKLRASLWSLQILVLYYPDNVLVFRVQLSEVFISACIYYPINMEVKQLRS